MPKDPGVLLSIDKLTRHIRVFGKFFRRIQQLSPKKFILLPECTDLILFYWDQVKQATGAPPNFIEGMFPSMMTYLYTLNVKLQSQILVPQFFRYGFWSRPWCCSGKALFSGPQFGEMELLMKTVWWLLPCWSQNLKSKHSFDKRICWRSGDAASHSVHPFDKGWFGQLDEWPGRLDD